MPQPYVTVTYRDTSGEKSTVSLYIPNIDPNGSDYEAIVGAADSQVVEIVNGLGLLTACTVLSYAVTIPIYTNPAPAAAPHYAHRENKMLITYTDQVNGRKGSFEVPGPDTVLFPVGAKDVYNIAAIKAALIAAANSQVEDNMLSRDGNAVEWDAAMHVGRNI